MAAQNLIKFGIDCLAVCGGDGSLTGADKLRGEWPSLIEELHQNSEWAFEARALELTTDRITSDELEQFRHLNIVGLVGSIEWVDENAST